MGECIILLFYIHSDNIRMMEEKDEDVYIAALGVIAYAQEVCSAT